MSLDLIMVKKLDAYRGKLSSAKIADGMNAAVANARLLLEDAKILLERKRYPTATSLAILAIEEDGKTPLLRYLALSTTEAEIRDAWKSYRSHTQKNIAWILPELAKRGARKLDDLYALVDNESDHPYLLDHIKQLGFYTDCLGETHWSVPVEVIDESLARGIVATAEVLVIECCVSNRTSIATGLMGDPMRAQTSGASLPSGGRGGCWHAGGDEYPAWCGAGGSRYAL